MLGKRRVKMNRGVDLVLHIGDHAALSRSRPEATFKILDSYSASGRVYQLSLLNTYEPFHTGDRTVLFP
jgi:hypothetical protein